MTQVGGRKEVGVSGGRPPRGECVYLVTVSVEFNSESKIYLYTRLKAAVEILDMPVFSSALS